MKRLFKQQPLSLFQLLFLLLIAAALMLLDQRWPKFHYYTSKASIIVTPIQVFIDAPIRLVHSMSSSIVAQRELLAENAKLRANQLLLESQLKKLLALESENAQLRQLLKSTPQIPGKVLVAQLLAVDLDPSLQQVILDRGSKDHVYEGQPVLDAYGVMGQVINVGVLTSKVLLLTDRRSAIPVQDYRNGIRAIAMGMGQTGKLALVNVPETSGVKVGDLFITSGLGLRFPMGYPVGVVDKFDKVGGERFAHITLVPSAHLDQTEQVLLVWTHNVALSNAVNKQLKESVPGMEQKK